MSYSPEAFVAELRTVLENVQTELSATGRNSARIQRCIDAMPSLAATLHQAARVDDLLPLAIKGWNEHQQRCRITTVEGSLRAALEAALSAQPAERQDEAVALNVRHPNCHQAANAFWNYWKANGETHKRGYYESTWGAINAALRMVGVVPHDYGNAPLPDGRSPSYDDEPEAHPAAPVGVPDGMVLVRKASLSYWQRELNGARQGDNAQQRAEIVHSGIAAYLAAAPSAPQGVDRE